MRKLTLIACLFCIAIIINANEPPEGYEKNWPQWRGPSANGVAPNSNPPVEWSESKNIKWKTALPGMGHATPVIWNDLVFVLAAVETEKEIVSGDGQVTKAKTGHIPFNIGTSKIHKYVIFAINRSDGKIAWQRTACEELPHEGVQKTASWASGSPVTDGKHIYAYFGSKGLYCYDMAGNLQWEKDFGDMNVLNNWGEGCSPVLYGDKLIVKWDHEENSFITALDKTTGQEIWKVDRDEGTSWATPLVVDFQGKPQVITSALNRIRSYDLATGEMIWESAGLKAPEVIPTPVTANGIVYLMCGGIFKATELKAVKLAEAKGDITGTGAIAWTLDKDTPYVSSPLLYDDNLYFLKGNDGTIACYDAASGKEYFSRKRLKGIGSVYASPVGAGGRIYVSSRKGTTKVIKHGMKFEPLAVNNLDDRFSASPAVAGNELYLRGEKNLYCIAED